MSKKITLFLFIIFCFIKVYSQTNNQIENEIVGKWNICEIKNKTGVRTTLHCLNEVVFKNDLTGVILYFEEYEFFKWKITNDKISFSQNTKKNDYIFHSEYEIKFTIKNRFIELELIDVNGDSIILRRTKTTATNSR